MNHIHKVGTITLGLSLIIFGCIFLLHMFFPVLNYELIFHIWPIIFILLGLEVLLSSKNTEFILDRSAVFLMIVLTCFACAMGMMDYCMEAKILLI